MGAAALAALRAALGGDLTAEDLFAYAYAILANPGYARRFRQELAVPGPRLPITKDRTLFDQAVALGRRLVWLHTYGERMAPEGAAPGEVPRGGARCTVAVPASAEGYPEDYGYDAATREVRVGAGRFGPVTPEVWDFAVSGFEFVKSWLGYRMKRRAGRRSSPLDDIGPRSWTAAMTEEFLELLWVLERTLEMYPALDGLLEAVAAGPCFAADELPPPTEAEREPPRRANQRQPRLV